MTRHGSAVIHPAKTDLRDRVALVLSAGLIGRCRLLLVRRRPESTPDHERAALMATKYLHQQCCSPGTSRHQN